MPYYPVINLSERRINYINEFNNNSKIKFEKISCLNCSSVNHKILFTNDKYGLNIKTVLCKKCGLVFLNPRMTQDSADFFYNSDLYRNILHEDDKQESNASAAPFLDITGANGDHLRKLRTKTQNPN